jgi:hypothetical protein
VDLVSIIIPYMGSSLNIEISRPDDTYDNNEDTETLDAVADKTDPVADRRFEGG